MSQEMTFNELRNRLLFLYYIRRQTVRQRKEGVQNTNHADTLFFNHDSASSSSFKSDNI